MIESSVGSTLVPSDKLGTKSELGFCMLLEGNGYLANSFTSKGKVGRRNLSGKLESVALEISEVLSLFPCSADATYCR